MNWTQPHSPSSDVDPGKHVGRSKKKKKNIPELIMARNHIPSMLTTERVMAKVIQHKGRTVRATLALDHWDTQPPL